MAFGLNSVAVPGKECVVGVFAARAVRAGLETGNAQGVQIGCFPQWQKKCWEEGGGFSLITWLPRLQPSLCLSFWPTSSLHPRVESSNWFVFRIALAKIMENQPSVIVLIRGEVSAHRTACGQAAVTRCWGRGCPPHAAAVALPAWRLKVPP